MATTTASINNLDSTYQSLINYQIQIESQPLTRLTTQQDALKLQKAVYNDLNTKLSSLLSSTKALLSTNPFYSLKPGRQVAVSNVDTGSTVVSAASSSSSLPGTYDISNISLALADRIRSDEQEYTDQALSFDGTFFIGGTENRSAQKAINNINSFGTGTITDGNTKLSDGIYYIETQKVDETWQFRLVNSNGSYQNIDGSGENGWQAIPTGGGEFSTGRGLTIDFGDDPDNYTTATKSTGAASVTFASQDDEYSIKSSQNTVSGFSTSDSIATGRQELGRGSYYVETRNMNGSWQFRIVDDEGNAEKIALGSSTSTFTSDWQSIPTGGGSYSTGRGLVVDFGTDSSQFIAKTRLTGASKVNYQSKGAEVSVTSDMTLNDIASAINKGTYAEGDEIAATIVNKQLVITSKLTGSMHAIQASGTVLEDLGILSGGSFKNVMQTAKDATFTVNGLNVTRSQNTGLTDVISGVTLNLASDAEGKSATLNVTSDNTAAKTAINSFITNFNSLQTYLASKMAVTKQTDGTYTRGSLAGDTSLMSLKSSLLTMVSSYDDVDGLLYKSLRDIGIGLNSSNTLAVTDSTKLENALKSNYSDATAVIDRVMTAINTKLSKYTGSTSYISQMIKGNESQAKSIANQITSWNARIEQRRVSLTDYYVQAQEQMTLLSYTSDTNSAWITSLYSSLYT